MVCVVCGTDCAQLLINHISTRATSTRRLSLGRLASSGSSSLMNRAILMDLRSPISQKKRTLTSLFHTFPSCAASLNTTALIGTVIHKHPRYYSIQCVYRLPNSRPNRLWDNQSSSDFRSDFVIIFPSETASGPDETQHF